MTFLWIVAGIILISAVLYFVPVKIDVQFKREGENDRLTVLTALGTPILRFKFSATTLELRQRFFKPQVAMKTKGKIISLDLRNVFKEGWYYKGVFLYLLNKTKIYKCHTRVEFGFEDPSITGILSGLSWGAGGALMGMAMQMGNFINRPEVEVMPHFKDSSLSVYFHGIFDIRLGHIITAGGKTIWHFLSRRWVKWRIIQSKAS